MAAENLFAFIGKPLGIGGIAMAGIIGIVKQSKIIRQAVGLAVSELGGGNKTAPAAVERTQRDLTMKRILTILIATLISVFVFFHFCLLYTSHLLPRILAGGTTVQGSL